MRRLLPLLLLLTLLSACAGAPDQPGETPQPGATAAAGQSDATVEPAATPSADGSQIVISHAAWEGERALYEPLAKKFMDENPAIKVVIVPLDDLMNNPDQNVQDSPLGTLRRIVSGADAAPAFFIAPEAYGSGLLLDLKPQMDADATFQRDDFYPGALEQYTVKGGTWMLPRFLNVQVLSYNKDLFKSAGLPEPQAGWTWTDLLGAAEQLAKKNGSKVETYGFLDSSGGFLPLAALLKEQGIDLLNTPADKIQLDRPEIVEAVKRIRSLVDSGALFRPQYGKEGPGGGPGVDMNQLIHDGHVAIWGQEFIAIDGPIAAGAPQQEPFSFAVGKAPYPTSFANFYGGGGADGFIISGGTAHPNEAWKWIEFLSRQQIEQAGPAGPQAFYGPGRIPARQSVAEQTGFWKNIDEETAAAYKWTIGHPGTSFERTPDYTIFGALGPALDQVLSEKKDPQKALQEAQKQLAAQIAEAQLTPTPKPDTGPVVVATPEAQEAPEGATPITFSTAGYNPSDLRRLARAFRDQHPEIFVQIKSTDTYTESPQLAKVAQTSDCFSWWAPPQSDADFKALLDLQPLFDADASFPQSDFAPALLAPYQRNGGLFGLPYAATLRTLNYNRTAFDAVGVQPPTYKWKPEDFLAAAQALTKGEGDKKQYGYVPLGGAQQDLFFFVNQFGASLMRGSGKDARPNFDDPKVAQAVQWYLDLAKVHKVMPALKFPYRPSDGFDDKSYELVQNGRAGMWFDMGRGMFSSGGPKGEVPGGQPPAKFEVGVAPLPIGAAGLGSTDLYMRGFHISAQTQQSQACWEWLKFLSADVTNLQGSLPARTSLLQDDAFVKQASPDLLEMAKVYSEALKQRPGQATQGGDQNAFYSWDQYWFFKALSEELEGKTELAKGLAEAQTMTTAYVECLAKLPNKPATCAKQVDPTYQGYSTEDPPEGPGGPAIAIPRG